MAIEPTYEEGIARGRSEQNAESQKFLLRSIFDRDAGTVVGLTLHAKAIRLSLGKVAACGEQATASRLAGELVDALEELEQHYEAEVIAAKETT